MWMGTMGIFRPENLGRVKANEKINVFIDKRLAHA